MTMITRPLTIQDVLSLNRVNLDEFTENFSISFYTTYLSQWPDMCLATVTGDGTIIGYMIAKVEGTGADWHAHLSAISVATEFRGRRVAENLMEELAVLAQKYQASFIDLFVRADNSPAIDMYKRLGYSKHRELRKYYADGGSALEMRKYL